MACPLHAAVLCSYRYRYTVYASGGDGQKRRKEEKRTVRETVKLELKMQLEPKLDSS